MIKISFVGDINPGGVLTHMGGVSKEVIATLSEADLRVGTLESAIGDGTKPCSIKMNDPQAGNIIFSPDKSLAVLKEMNINIVTLANNHAGDLGEEGLIHTMEMLDSYGIKHVGAGRNIDEASKPLIVELNGKTVCFLAYLDSEMRWIRLASKHTAGANPMVIKNVIQDIGTYKKKYDYVIILAHWGREKTIWPEYDLLKMCRIMAKAGADAIVSSHTHIAQPIIKYRNAIVSPGLGNFLFPDRYIDKPRKTVFPTREQILCGNIPQVKGFPFVEKLSLKVVESESRIGEVLTVNFNNDNRMFKVDFTYLDNNNTLLLKGANVCFIKKYHKVSLYIENMAVYKLKVLHDKVMRKLKKKLKTIF